MLRDSTPGTPIYQDHLDDIVSLENIQMLTVVGFAFDDKDASKLASSKSIKRVGLHGTAVTAAGEAKLASEEKLVFRD